MRNLLRNSCFALAFGVASLTALPAAKAQNAPFVSLPTSRVLAPRVMPTRFQTDDIILANAVATDAAYGAKPDGKTDCTSAVQNAIDTVAKSGGGGVFLPEGHYLFRGSLILREGVTLRGEWKNPNPPIPTLGNLPIVKASPLSHVPVVGKLLFKSKRLMTDGTILMPTGGRGEENGTPFITMERGTGVRNLNIWYPDQTPENIVAYPWTIRGSAEKPGDNYKVQQVTLVNSYQAIKFGPEWNELHTIREVYGTHRQSGAECSRSKKWRHAARHRQYRGRRQRFHGWRQCSGR